MSFCQFKPHPAPFPLSRRQLVTPEVLQCSGLLREAIAKAFFTEVKIIHPVVNVSGLGIDFTLPPTPTSLNSIRTPGSGEQTAPQPPLIVSTLTTFQTETKLEAGKTEVFLREGCIQSSSGPNPANDTACSCWKGPGQFSSHFTDEEMPSF